MWLFTSTRIPVQDIFEDGEEVRKKLYLERPSDERPSHLFFRFQGRSLTSIVVNNPIKEDLSFKNSELPVNGSEIEDNTNL
jgi:hypothetical protein